MMRNASRSRLFVLLGIGVLLLVGVTTAAFAEGAPRFSTRSPANEAVGGMVQFKGRVTHAGNGRIVLEDPRVLTHDPIPGDVRPFRVFVVDDSTVVTDARGDAWDLECMEPLSWALVEVPSGQEDDAYPLAYRVCAIDLQTHLDAMEEPAVERPDTD